MASTEPVEIIDFEVRAFHLLQDSNSLRAGLEVIQEYRINPDIEALSVDGSPVSVQTREVVGFGALAVCSESGSPLGFGVATLRGIVPGAWTLEHAETVREHRGKGIGREVVSLLVDRARFSGGVTISADSTPSNNSFFEGLGFERKQGSSAYSLNLR
jgi:ribosomal protein S18 acetylase RimI-like enzyme